MWLLLEQGLADDLIGPYTSAVRGHIHYAGPHNLFANMDKFKSVAKGGWHPEKSRANSGSSTGGQSDSKLGQVVREAVPCVV